MEKRKEVGETKGLSWLWPVLVLTALATVHAASAAAQTSVDIVRDIHGVPHVFAPTAEAAFYGVGWVTAQDRLFQMEMSRRMMRGRLAEVLDPAIFERVVALDKKARLLGFGAAADQLAGQLASSETRTILAAFSDGVNAYVTSLAGDLPAAFDNKGITTFDPWTPADSLLVWWQVQDAFDSGWMKEPTASCPAGSGLIDASGAVVACPPSSLASRAAPPIPQEPSMKASHAWVVDGDHTTTGKPALHNDPQLTVHVPSVFYEYHVSGGAYDVRGVSPAGAVGMLIGWSDDIAWGATAMGGEASDLYTLTVTGPTTYLVDGQQKTMTDVHTETISIFGGGSETVTFKQTQWGPVVTETLVDFCKVGCTPAQCAAGTCTSSEEYALRRLMFDDTDRHTVVGLLQLMKATDKASIDSALTEYRGPGLHFIYAEASGEIGYQALAAIPIRPPNAPCWGTVPLDGSLGRSDWRGTIPLADLPKTYDPPEGFLSTANNLAADPSCVPFNLVLGFGGDTLRSWRLRESLAGQLAAGPISPAAVLDLHTDAVDPAMRVFTQLALQVQQNGALTPGSAADLAADQLALWNAPLPLEDHYSLFTDLDQSSLLYSLEHQLTTTFRQPNPLALQFGGGITGLANFGKTAEQDIALWAADSDVISWVQTLLTDGWNNPPPPEVYPSYELTFGVHLQPLCGPPHLSATPCSLDPANDFTAGRPLKCTTANTLWSQRGNTYSQFVDFADLQQSKSVTTPGQTDDPSTFLYKNHEATWIQGGLNTAPLERTAIQEASTTTLIYP